MNHPKSSKLTHTEQEQLAELAAQTTQQTALEFATPEEMLRHDSHLTHVPPSLVERLRASIHHRRLRPAQLHHDVVDFTSEDRREDMFHRVN